jgi:methylglyoxal reductase
MTIDWGVSKLCYGAMGLNGAFGSYSEREFIDSIHYSLDRGINMIDTARAYGHSETIIGKALKEWTGEKPFIATKVKAAPSGGWGLPREVKEAYPPGAIRNSVEASLRELGVDQLDLIQMHQYWPQWNSELYWLDELNALKSEGKVRYIGVSVPDHRHDLAISLVQQRLIDSVQTIINIFDPLALDSLVPICHEHGVAVLARCVLDEGGLTGFLQESSTFADRDFRNQYFDAVPRQMYIDRVEKLRQFIPEHASSLASLAIKFVLSHPGITSAVISMHVQAYAQQNIDSLSEAPLSKEVMDEIRKKHRWVRNFYESKYW